ncbi:acyltransferase family protein [Pantoea dispersa]|uniref:Acyltransferase n=1 Tax=Pantoea dispersa TaxID=59814 RepID=A0ABY3A1V9_9GAMM|nr:acyltransferase [Pantoea dispersa]TQC76645.1 acyltransferase [Pantoea dispersa]
MSNLLDKNISSKTEQKNLNIQILRAIAIIMVVLQHYKIRMPTEGWYLSIFKYVQFWPGVDIFLAISGYLMCKSLLKESQNNERFIIIFKRFIVKRMFRLYPVLLLWGILTILICFFSADRFFTNAMSELKTFLASMAAVSNFYLYHCVKNGYLCSNASGGVTWSLSLEWQLYVVLALLVIPLVNRQRFLITIFLLICIGSIFIPAAEPQNQAYAWWIRPIPFFLGATTFFIEKRIVKFNMNLAILLCTLSFIALITAPVYSKTQYVSLSIGLAGGLIFYIFVYSIKFNENILVKLLNWIGDRSYSIYLCHIPSMIAVATLLEYLSKITNHQISNIWFMMAYIILMLTLAHVTYKYVELYFISKNKK